VATDAQVLKRVVTWLRQCGTPCYVAGGYVRDWLLGRSGKDIDVTVPPPAIPLARRLADATGGAFFVLDDETDAARIVYRSAGGFVVDVAAIREGDIMADLRARDFTVNAMAVDIRDWGLPQPPILDPCGGQQDLADGILRATHEGAFRRDPLRLLRGVRLIAALGLQIEPQTSAWMRRDAPLLVRPSAERIRQELALILAAPDAANHVRRLDELDLLEVILPEVVALKGVAQPPDHHFYDVYDHTLAAMAEVERLTAFPRAAFSPEEEPFLRPFAADLAAHFAPVVCEKRTRATLLKFAALLHDVGKPQKRMVKENGQVSFYEHEGVSAEMSANILSRLRFSAQEVQLVSAVVAGHMRPGFLVKDAQRAPVTRRAMYRYFRATGDAAVDVLILSLADHLAARGPNLDIAHWREHLAFTSQMLDHYFREPQEVANPPQLVTGRDVMSLLGISPGPQVGDLLEAMREAQAEGRVRTREEALGYLRSQETH